MKTYKMIAVRLAQETHDYFKALAEENQSTVSHEVRQILINASKDKLKK